MPHVATGIMKHHRVMMEEIIDKDIDGVSEYIDLDKVRPVLKKAKRNASKAGGGNIQILWRTVALSLWLRQEKQNKINI
jgi:asparagine synthase (glutamine-hydrolysing)